MEPIPPRSESDLAGRAAAGDLAAFEALVLRHQDRIYGIIHRLVGDPDQALDLAQETFLRAWRGISGFRGHSGVFTWLYRIARNVVTSQARHDAARPRPVASLDAGGEEGRASRPEPCTPWRGPEEATLDEERKRLVLDAVARLPRDQKEIVVLRDLAGHSYEEISELLEIPVGTVRSRLHRARRELRERLGGMLDGEVPPTSRSVESRS